MKEFMNEFKRKGNKIELNNYFLKSGLKIEKHISIRDSFPFRNVIYNHFHHYQGWKIHLSPTLDKYPSVLNEIIKLLQNKSISFKYVPDLKSFFFLSNKNTSISQLGKYITIYPKDKDEFIYIIEKIHTDIKCGTGVIVPSDQKYKNSNFIYYRYGGAFPIYETSNENKWEYQILDGFGELIEDSRKGFFTLPSGIRDPFENKVFDEDIVQEVIIKGETTSKEFTINNILRHCATGNVYEGRDATNNKEIIVKEGRLGGIPSLKEPLYRAHKARMNEFEFLKNNKNKYNILFPESIDYFYEEDSLFIIMEKLNGKSLKEMITENPLTKPEKNITEKEEYIRILKNSFMMIFKFILDLHSNGFVFNDISDDNFIITSEGQVALIDAEGISRIENNEWYDMGTERFMYRMPMGIESKYKDIYMFSQLVLYSVTGKNKGYYYDQDYYEKEYEAILPLLPQETRGIFNAGLFLRDIALKKQSPNSIWCDFQDKINKNYDEGSGYNESTDQKFVDKIMGEIDIIKRTLYRYYSNVLADNPQNILKFRTTDYNNNRLSLVYGLPGVALCLRELKIIDEKQLLEIAYILQDYAVREDNLNKLNDGLIFGKSGLALYLQEAGVPLENNLFLLGLIKKLSTNSIDNLDFANGLSGICMALKLLNNKQKDIDFSNHIKLITNRLINENCVIDKYQGLEYGNSGLAYCLIYESMDKSDWEKKYSFIKEDLDTVKEDKVFTGLSYSIQEWPNIRSPYLYSGGAGVILILIHHYHNGADCDWEVLYELVSSLKSPFSYNYGITYGSAGLALVIMGVLLLPNIPDKYKKEFDESLMYKINYITTHFHRDDDLGILGFLGDKHSFYADDFGSGGLGILRVLEMYRDYVMDELTWESYKFSALPILSDMSKSYNS